MQNWIYERVPVVWLASRWWNSAGLCLPYVHTNGEGILNDSCEDSDSMTEETRCPLMYIHRETEKMIYS